MTFEYLQRVVVDAQLEIDNIGECVLRGRSDLGEEEYLIIRTEQGFTEVIDYGPVDPTIELLPMSITLHYNRFEYNQNKLCRIIDRFLNDPKRLITQADVTSFEEIDSNIQDSLNKILRRRIENEQC